MVSIRSVTTKPPTMLIVASATATSPSTRIGVEVGRAGDQDRPDQDHPVDGVRTRHERRVQRRRDLGDHLDPDEHSQDEDREVVMPFPDCWLPVGSGAAVFPELVPLLPELVEGLRSHLHRGDDLVVEVRRELAVAGHQQDHADHVGGVQAAGRAGHLAGHVGSAPDLGAADGDHAPGHHPLDVAAGLRGQVDDDRPRLHPADHLRGDQQRGLPARHRGGRDQRVGGGDVRGEQLALQPGPLLGHLPGVAAGALQRGQRQLDGHRAHRADLLGRGGAYVVALHHGTQPATGGDRLQPGHPGAEHDDLGRGHGARRRSC